MKSWADFKSVLPYASDLFGVFQPLLRWKSRVIDNRFENVRNGRYSNLAEQARSSQRAPLRGQLERQSSAELATDTGRQAPSISDLNPVAFVSEVQPPLAPDIDCGIARLLQRDIGSNPPKDWRCVITTELMTMRLEKFKTIVTQPAELQKFPDIDDYVQTFAEVIGSSDQTLPVQALFEKEARICSYLTFLARHKPTQLNELFFTAPQDDNPPASLEPIAAHRRLAGHQTY
jgi:hypothetical protein